ncbi:MAG TPA: hypothetical protein VM736_03310 [Gemmatimonadales bacterium]|nr:hypothetical protein [Gemmatimonadales bacterium]
MLDQLETILRHVAEELTSWRSRALKAEGELKEGGGRAGAAGGAGATGLAKLELDVRNRVSDLEQENKTLKQRVEAARLRVHDLLSRLTFLEEQARETGGNGGSRSGGAGGPSIGGGSSAGSGGGVGSGGPGGARA